MAWPDGPHTVLVELFRDGAWVDVSTLYRSSPGIRIQHGQVSGDDGTAAPASIQLELDATSGTFARLPRSTPLRVTVNGVERFEGPVFSRPVRWDRSSSTAAVTLQGAGPLARVKESGAKLRSTPRRWVPTTSPVAYWPLDDGQLIEAAAGLPIGVAPMRPLTGTHPSGAAIGSPRWGQGDLALWLDPVVSRSGSADLTVLWSTVDMPAFAGTWTIDFVYNSGTNAKDSAIDVNPSYLSGSLGWPQLGLWPATQETALSLAGLPEVVTSVPQLYDSQAHHVRWTCTQNGSNVDYSVAIDGAVVSSGSVSSFTLPAITTLGLVATPGAEFTQGHVPVWTSPPALAAAAQVAHGYRDETAGRRAERLCAEEGAPFTAIGDLDDTAPMGPQLSGLTLVEHLQQCAAADGALVHDGPDGITFRTRASMCNQAVALALDHNARGHIAPPIVPVQDDRIVNDATVTREGGSAQQVVRTAGPLGTAAIGVRSATATANVSTDEQAARRAGWIVHRGTIGEPRFEVRVNLLADPTLAADATAVRVGDRITIANLPIWCDLPTADLLVLGITETVRKSVGWELLYNCVPYAPFEVGELDSAWLDTDGTTLTADITDSATSFSAAVAGPLWTTSGGDFPTTIRIEGEDMTLTAVSGGSSPQTFTVTRAAGSVAHPAGAAVQLVHPLVLTP